MTILYLIITILAWPLGRSVDYFASQNFRPYAMKEGNGLFWLRRKDGSLNNTSAIITTAVLEIGLLAIFFFASELVAMLASLLVGGQSLIRGLLVRQSKAKQRDAQIRMLKGNYWHQYSYLRRDNGELYNVWFPWIVSTKPDEFEAKAEVNAKLEQFRLTLDFPA